MKQVYPRYKRSRPLPFPLEDCSFPRSGLSDLATLGQTTVRSRKRKVLSRKRKSGLDLFLSGIYLFPALQNIYSLRCLSGFFAVSLWFLYSFFAVSLQFLYGFFFFLVLSNPNILNFSPFNFLIFQP